MSNLIFPPFNPPQFNWGWPIKKTTMWNTLRATPASAVGEVRIPLQQFPLWDFDIDMSYIKGDLQTPGSALSLLTGFYARMNGGADDWLFQDPYDKTIVGALLGYGDAVTQQFQVGRILANAAFEKMQNVFPTAFYINGAAVPAGPQASGNQWYCGLENQLYYSQDFSQTVAWNAGTTTLTANQTTAPDGTNTGNKIARLGSSGTYAMTQTLAPSAAVAGDLVSASCWFKLNTAALKAAISIVYLNSLGTILGRKDLTAVSLTSTWTRLSVSDTVPFGAAQCQFLISISNTTSVGDSVWAWGAQFERWATPTSYVATAGVAPIFPRGQVSFTIAPALSLAVTADYGFYFRCCFTDDEWSDMEQFMYQISSLKSLKFHSLLL